MKFKTILNLVLTIVFMVSLYPLQSWGWGSFVHKEVALDAWYFMEHSSFASQRQRDAIGWFFQTFHLIQVPWEKVAAGTTWPDEVEYVCFVGLSHKKGFWGHNFNSWFHFLDLYSASLNYNHVGHSGCGNFELPDYAGEHNFVDGYNYRRHEELIADYDTDDIDSWAAWWIDDDNFCMQHSSTGLQLYEFDQGGKNGGGLLIGPNNHSCYTKWDDDNPNSDFWNIIFAPIDNTGRAYYQSSTIFRNLAHLGQYYQYLGLFYLGAALHAADASVLHHVLNSTDWGHSEIESWANRWYSDQQWFQNKHQEIKWYIDSFYRVGGVDPVDRPFRWLVHRLASVAYTSQSINEIWNRYVSEDDYDASYWNYCVRVYPATVAFAVIVMEKFYLGKTEVPQQQSYDHALAENIVFSVNPSVNVRVIKYHLVDETNPEWAGSDDIYGKFKVEDGIKAENHRIPSSGEYDMDDGDSKTLDKLIFQTSHVGDHIKINVEIWDADTGSDDIVGRGNLYFSAAQNWGKGGTYKIQCKYPDTDGHMDVYIKIE